MATTPCGAGVTTAKPCVEYPPTQARKCIAYIDLNGGAGECIPARLATESDHKAAAFEDAEQFRHIRTGNALAFGDLWNGERCPGLGFGQGQQAAKPIFLLC